MDHNQWETTSYDCTVVFNDSNLEGLSYTTNKEPNSVSYEMISITQPDGMIIKKMAKLCKYDGLIVCLTAPEEFKNECIYESLI